MLAEWWHNEHNTFHLLTREASITLEDVYCILQVPCYGDSVSCLFGFFVMFLQCDFDVRCTDVNFDNMS